MLKWLWLCCDSVECLACVYSRAVLADHSIHAIVLEKHAAGIDSQEVDSDADDAAADANAADVAPADAVDSLMTKPDLLLQHPHVSPVYDLWRRRDSRRCCDRRLCIVSRRMGCHFG